jgi:hypothetical protein
MRRKTHAYMKTVIEIKEKKKEEINYKGRCTEKKNECLLLLLSFVNNKSHSITDETGTKKKERKRK